MKTIKEAILTRRTAKRSLTDPVEQQLLLDLLEQASQAPYHKEEPWYAKVITTEVEKIYLAQEIIDFYKEIRLIHDDASKEKFTKKINRLIKEAPATILFAYKQVPHNRRLDSDASQATAALIQNFSLLLDEHRLVGFWASSPFVLNEEFTQRLGFPEGTILVANYRVGYKDESLASGVRKRRPVKEWVSQLDIK
ncbi:nitroreductase family protein [Enterococcus bulliens]